MADVIDFPPPKDNGPDPEFRSVIVEDGKPVEWFTFSVQYHDQDEDAHFGFHIWARDFADAERRLKFIRENGEIKGRVHTQIPL